ncbi:MAG: hypothetical protein M1168_03435 [Candidatus Marsarchaeota archaeon]|nr:hypothetical protein [Candidatus Marsarchaeota archaeon]
MFFMKLKNSNEKTSGSRIQQTFDKTIKQASEEFQNPNLNFYDIVSIYEKGIKELKEINKNEAIDSGFTELLIKLETYQLNFIKICLSNFSKSKDFDEIKLIKQKEELENELKQFKRDSS